MRQEQQSKKEIGSTGRFIVFTPGPVTKLPVDHEPPSQNSHTPYWNDYEGFHDNVINSKFDRNRSVHVTSPKFNRDFKTSHNEGLRRMAKIGNSVR
ncbi:12718_t:CDS:2 [Cetraspora pellucida]|uniref:12718_t:CDS:1 n=1 Tax=Cetraspora pellucida TaxID=1433469 RepID=A0A9N8Z9T4_9GLOM|nr:12718_t:CDS:2 [Cetraspora pellucida]